MRHVAAARFLLERGGVDVNGASPKHGDTPLHRACRSGQLPLVKMLLEAGADVNVENKDGDSPARIAQYFGFPDIARMLAADN
jgi:ankyrin repeat protein